MNSFSVEINFKKGPSFSCTSVPADDESQAKEKALYHARQNGFRELVKKIKIK